MATNTNSTAGDMGKALGAANTGMDALGKLSELLFGKKDSTSMSVEQMNQLNQLVEQISKYYESDEFKQQTDEQKKEFTNQLTSLAQNIKTVQSEIVKQQSKQQQTVSDIDSVTLAKQKELHAKTVADLANVMNNGSKTKEAAIKDSQSAMDAAIQTVLKQGMGDVAQATTNFGSYDSTVQNNLANELSALAAREGAAVQLGTMQNYEQQRQQEINSLLQNIQGLFTGIRGAETVGTTTGNTTTNTSGTTNQDTTSTQQTQLESFLQTINNMIGSSNKTGQATDTSKTDSTSTTDTTSTEKKKSAGLFTGLLGFGG